MALPIAYRRRPNARRYILRLNEDANGGCVTIPRGGSLEEARRFARRNAAWLEERLRRARENFRPDFDPNTVLFRGEIVPLVVSEKEISFGGHTLRRAAGADDLSACVKAGLWRLARRELPARVGELAARHGLPVQRVSVRDQRSRWGSCSVRRVISLNWRLIQTPAWVSDYIIVHELMHLREMNHSARFWKHVRDAFPQTDDAERWLKAHARLLRR
jgi:predicted metal-dependent hydrolase